MTRGHLTVSSFFCGILDTLFFSGIYVLFTQSGKGKEEQDTNVLPLH